MISRFITAKFLVVFVPAFLLLTAFGLYSIAEKHITAAGDQLAARIGSHLGRVSGLITMDLASGNPRLTSDIISTLLSDPAITCVDLMVSGAPVRHLAQPRNLGCQILKPEKTVEATIVGAPGLKMRIGFHEMELATLRRETHLLALFTALAGLVAAVLFGVLAFRYTVGRPLSRLLFAIRESQRGRFQHAPVNSQDEIGNLCSDFNSMLDKLEEEKNRTQDTLDDLNNVYNTTPALLFTMNAKGIICSASDYWLRESGYSASEVVDRSLKDLVSSDSRALLKCELFDKLKSEGSLREVPLCFWCKDGREIDVLLSVVPDRRKNSCEDSYVCVMNDVTLLRRTEENLRLLAVTDQLTNLPNRRAVNEYFSVLDQPGKVSEDGWAVFFIDLDNFKTVNDTFGHEAGDEILRVGADRICEVVGESGLVARIGGDEFAVILPDLNCVDRAKTIATNLIDTLSRPVKLASGVGHVGASVGIAYCDDQSLVPSEALRLSDQAMYLAKCGGKNRFALYEEERTANLRSRAEQIQLIQTGLDKDWFEIYLQPIIDMTTTEPFAFEALLRIRQNKEFGGSIEDLIRVAEETGQMEALGEWIFEESISRFRCLTCDAANPKVAIAINLSPHQLTENFVRQVKRCMKRYPDMAGRLIFEITETAAMSRIDTVFSLLEDLRRHDIRIAIDDFGSGYSSLSYISRLPVDILKLDKSFIDSHASKEPANAKSGVQETLVRSVASLASDLGLELVAEGLETEELIEQFRSLGVRLGQGYIYSRPMPIPQAKMWLKAFTPNGPNAELMDLPRKSA